jgi:hypothetical protein
MEGKSSALSGSGCFSSEKPLCLDAPKNKPHLNQAGVSVTKKARLCTIASSGIDTHLIGEGLGGGIESLYVIYNRLYSVPVRK